MNFDANVQNIHLLGLVGVILCAHAALKVTKRRHRRYKIRPINRKRRCEGHFNYYKKMKSWDRFCEGTFLDHSEATIGVDYRSRTLELDGERITLQLWDTAGQERYRMTMVSHYYRKTDAIVLVYDVTNVSSFNSLKKWIEESNMNCKPDVPKILVGNKCDENIAVSTNEAQKFADQHNMPLFQTSARLDSQYDHVESIFLTLAYKLKNRRTYLPLNDHVKITAEIVKDTTTSNRCLC